EQAIHEIGQTRPDEKSDAVQRPECAVHIALAARAVAQVHRRDPEHHHAHQDVHELEADHAASAGVSDSARTASISRASDRSSNSSRVPWITKAQIAVGIAHTASCVASTMTPLCSRKLLMSRIDPMAMKISSP